jgi:hypothetical protein
MGVLIPQDGVAFYCGAPLNERSGVDIDVVNP